LLDLCVKCAIFGVLYLVPVYFLQLRKEYEPWVEARIRPMRKDFS